MNPALLLQLLQGSAAVGSSALRSAGDIIPTSYERDNKKRLLTLKDLMESGSLGLSDEEKARIYETQSSGLEKQLQAQEQAANQLAQTGAGQSLKTATALQANAAQTRQAINRDVEAMNQTKALKQEQELWAREQADTAAKQNRINALLGIPATALDVASGAMALNKTVAPKATGKDLKASLADDLVTNYGLSPEEAEKLAGASIDDPALLNSLTGLMK